MKAFGGVFALIVCAFLAAALLPPDSPWLPECFLYKSTGYLCSACGCTRALRALAQGDIVQSLRWNALLLPTFLWLLALALLRGRAFTYLLWGGGGVILLFGMVRNLPFSWADCLRP